MLSIYRTPILKSLLLIVTFQASKVGYASIYDPQTLRFANKTYARQIQRMLYTEIAGHLNKTELMTLSRTKLEQPWKGTTPPLDFVSSSSQYLIRIPTASAKFLDDITVAQSWIEQFNCNEKAVMDYISALELNPAITGNVLDSLAIPQNAYAFDHAVNDKSQTTFRSGTVFILLHQLGHIHLKHQDDKRISARQARQQEIAADKFALDVSLRMKLPPQGISLYFTVLSYMEPTMHSSYRSHPLSAHRLRALSQGLIERAEQWTQVPQPTAHDVNQTADILTNIAENLESDDYRGHVRRRGIAITPSVLKKACNRVFYENFWLTASDKNH